MVYAIALQVLATASGLLFGWAWWWRWRKLTGGATALLLLVSSVLHIGAIASVRQLVASVVAAGIMFLNFYALFNVARITNGRAGEAYTRRSALLTFAWIGLAQIFLALALLNGWYEIFSVTGLLAALAGVQLLVALAVVWSTKRQIRATRLPRRMPEISDGQLPTVTVAVPVRNEDQQLEACLTSLLSSNYPKLEILAFDDHSTDRTPDVIKQFAHAGVRFIRSDEPSNGWLAKNQAYHQLAKAASGEVLLFCGADVRVGPRTLRQLVALMHARRKTMLTIVPQNRLVRHVPLLQAMRYYWEMSPPRRMFHRPPILSSFWLIKRDALEAAGGFAAVRRSVSPEAHMARFTASHDDGYSFVRSNDSLGVWSEKTARDQRSTAILRRYQQAHRRPEMVLVFTLGQSALLVCPMLVFAAGLGLLLLESWRGETGSGILLAGWLVGASLGAFLLHSWAFGIVQRKIFTRVPAWRVYAALIPCIVADIWYLHRSMYSYEFTDVSWKGRQIAGPVMHRASPE